VKNKKFTRYMENVYIVARYLHIGAGIVAFVVAPVALVAKKAGRTHIFWGSIFFWAMLLVAFSAVPMTIYKPNIFLFLVAIFSTHLVLSGYRASAARKTASLYQSRLIDKGIAFGSLITYLLLIAWGIHTVLCAANTAFGFIAMVFGVAGLRFSASQLRQLYRPSAENMGWWFRHMQGMVGAYIATVSAFSAVNFYFLPPVIRWLWPTVIGTIGLYIWISYYKRKFKKASAGTAVAV
jgi:hypothetical protein